MRRYVLVICVLFTTLNGFAQKIIKVEKATEYSSHVIGNNFEGVIFTKDYTFLLPNQITNRVRFTPSGEDVTFCEEIIKPYLDSAAKKNGYAGTVKNHLRKYNRQYFGYLNDAKERIVFINCFPKGQESFKEKVISEDKKSSVPRWQNELIEVLDGGTGFWRIEINLDKKIAYGFNTNGFG